MYTSLSLSLCYFSVLPPLSLPICLTRMQDELRYLVFVAAVCCCCVCVCVGGGRACVCACVCVCACANCISKGQVFATVADVAVLLSAVIRDLVVFFWHPEYSEMPVSRALLLVVLLFLHCPHLLLMCTEHIFQGFFFFKSCPCPSCPFCYPSLPYLSPSQTFPL